MNTAREIEEAIERLSPEEQERFARWFEGRFQDLWDRQLADDAASGKLETLYQRMQRENAGVEEQPLDDLLDDR